MRARWSVRGRFNAVLRSGQLRRVGVRSKSRFALRFRASGATPHPSSYLVSEAQACRLRPPSQLPRQNAAVACPRGLVCAPQQDAAHNARPAHGRRPAQLIGARYVGALPRRRAQGRWPRQPQHVLHQVRRGTRRKRQRARQAGAGHWRQGPALYGPRRRRRPTLHCHGRRRRRAAVRHSTARGRRLLHLTSALTSRSFCPPPLHLRTGAPPFV